MIEWKFNEFIFEMSSKLWKKIDFKEAIAIVFEAELERFDSPECYFNTMRLELQEKRDFMVNLLKEVKMEPIIPQAGYFILADWTALGKVSSI